MAKTISDNRLYLLFMVATLLLSGSSLALSICNYAVARRNMASGGSAVSATAPNYPERAYRLEPGKRAKKEFNVLGIEFLKHGFLSSRAATAMLVGTFFWPMIFLGYRAELLARRRTERESMVTSPSPPGGE